MEQQTYDLLESTLVNQIKKVKTFDTGTKEGKEALGNVIRLAELIITADRDYLEYEDKKERREIDKKRNETMEKIERDKQKLTWGRVLLRVGEVTIPVVVPIIAYNEFQKRLLKFEEKGYLSTTAGRELHLPKFMK